MAQSEPLLNSSFFTDYLSSSCIDSSNQSSSSSVLDVNIIDDYHGTTDNDNNNQTSIIKNNETHLDHNDSDNDSSDNSDSDSDSWIFDLLGYLGGWLTTSTSFEVSQINEESCILDTSVSNTFWEEWEWVLSRTELIAKQQSSDRVNEIDEELANLRRSAIFLKKKPYFYSIAQKILSPKQEHDTQDDISGIFTKEQLNLLQTYSLDAPLRSKLLRDVIDQFSSDWLNIIGEIYFSSNTDHVILSNKKDNDSYNIFIENYAEKPYAKNITGTLISMGFIASHGSLQNLTVDTLGDILWAFWRTLLISISEIVSSDKLTDDSNHILAQNIINAGPVIARLWHQTAEQTQKISSLGTLPSLWKLEEKNEQDKLTKIKNLGLVDAKYRDGSNLGQLKSSISDEKLKQLKNKLQNIFQS